MSSLFVPENAMKHCAKQPLFFLSFLFSKVTALYIRLLAKTMNGISTTTGPILKLFLSLVFILCFFPPVEVSAAITAQQHSSEARRIARDESIRRPFAVFGYLPEYRSGGYPYNDVFEHSGLTHLIFFSIEIDPSTLELTHVADRLPSNAKADGSNETAWESIRRAADTHNVKLMVCIGGGGRSNGFAPLMRADRRTRQRFYAQLNDLVLARQLDGIDFNWEYPTSHSEWALFGQFLREARSSLGFVRTRSNSTSSNGAQRMTDRQRVRRVTLTLAVHPHPMIAALMQEHRIIQSLDYVHWMAYDNMQDDAGHHSSVSYSREVLRDHYLGALDDAHFTVGGRDRAAGGEGKRGEQAEKTRASGSYNKGSSSSNIPLHDHRRKVTLGIPFYGRNARGEAETYGRLQLLARQTAEKQAMRNHKSQEDVLRDLKSVNTYGGYRYNSYDDVKQKMEIALKHHIAGIMIWELGQDMLPPSSEPLSLMRAVTEFISEFNCTKPLDGGPSTLVGFDDDETIESEGTDSYSTNLEDL